jgi:hypothetical protein
MIQNDNIIVLENESKDGRIVYGEEILLVKTKGRFF